MAAVSDVFGPRPPQRIGVAVSGGGDSIALLSVMAKYAVEQGVELCVITVDHGLRPEFKHEAAVVTDLCQKLVLPHHMEYWSNWDGAGNMQAEARDGRYALMADWAYAQGIKHIALGHTADDQAETVLMRLARASGLDGLSAMPLRHVRYGIEWVRPFLGIRRETLRLYLQASSLKWIDDPSNLDRGFERVRVRDALTVLETLGVGVDALSEVADHLRQAREALNWQTFLLARDIVDIQAGAVVMPLNRFRAQPTELKRRLLVHVIQWLNGQDYPPRRDATARALTAIDAGQTITVMGCQMSHADGHVWIYRELKAVADVRAELGETWDVRWQVDGPDDDAEIEIRPLGYEVLAQIEGWRDMGIPRAALAVTPSVWWGTDVIAAPVVVEDDEWSAELDGGKDGFFAALLSH